MMKKWFLWIFLILFSASFAQEVQNHYQTKKIIATKDTIFLEKVSINPSFFQIEDKNNKTVDSLFYKVDFQKGMLLFNENYKNTDTLTVNYLKFPDFLTKEYSIYDDSKVVPNEAGKLYAIKTQDKQEFKPFDGLNTSGSISRGITVGNNQNTVVNSNLDLQVTGKISEKVSLRASIQDSNIPLQEGGYSQKLDEFDQIFIELFSDKWSIKAGDLFLENRQSQFLNFNKKVQGLSTKFTLGTLENKTDIFAAAALVRGQYARSTFIGQEGNQGPYKLKGNNGELFVLVVSGSERVYVNGVLLERGENNDYIIDYNAGEVIFTSLFQITSEMRIIIEYQFSDRNYTRFVTYSGVMHEQEKFKIGGFVYSENDIKNQPLQQNLSEEQVAILKDAGDNPNLMNAPSAYLDSYSENKILYKKSFIGTTEIFEFSNNPNDELYNVRFTFIGQNLGNYILLNNNAVGKIYEYIAPNAGIPQGNYEPIIPLIAPDKIQIATILGSYNPSEKTNIDFELALSNNDKNLFSSIDDTNNKGIAGKINLNKRIYSGKYNVDSFGNFQFINRDFKTIERLFNIEFNRDWNLSNPLGNQSLLTTGMNLNLKKNGFTKYQFEKLDFSENFSGNRHIIESFIKFRKTTLNTNFSTLNSTSSIANSTFIRNQSQVRHHFHKNWIGSSLRFENNKEKLIPSNEFTNLSQRFIEYGAFVGRGDSTKVFTEIGYLNRTNDSLQNGQINRVNHSDSYYLKSQLIKNSKSSLNVFINYRNLKYEDESKKNEPSLNSRVLYNNNLFNNLLQTSIAYETTSGTIAQQEFTYLEVEPGQGVYTWNDYNNNGIQELQEFEVATFTDQAKFVRVFLPNQIFIRTHQNKFSQSLNFNGSIWQNETAFKKLLSYFYNQTSFLVERKIARNENDFDLNPFSNNENIIGLNNSFRNSLFYNRGKQKHSMIYTYLNSKIKSLLNVGSQENNIFSHQFQYNHLIAKSWLIQLKSSLGNTISTSENYSSRNFDINNNDINPKLSYLFSKNASWDIFYEYKSQENTINALEKLEQNRIGTSFSFNSEKGFTLNGEYSLYNNNFSGNQLSPVAFQMLQGLQAGKNSVWRLLLQKNITKYLDININYQGRKSETSKTIHNGNIQLRAFF
ncbi:hypothetical protein FIA58_012750 [Flavobacterium jejuense]|uniref:Outer membrane protein beta-barrel domain-containing protein n=1 Tax=Flavobacterium jejuense TaxID=1544455 RepID=A0ABX0IVI2_9FLAO|nr:hypothetical protein [Flavobacterium jejuense]NHN26548.1 hypothetical protein [Flavobacterium jejuense]